MEIVSCCPELHWGIRGTEQKAGVSWLSVPPTQLMGFFVFGDLQPAFLVPARPSGWAIPSQYHLALPTTACTSLVFGVPGKRWLLDWVCLAR